MNDSLHVNVSWETLRSATESDDSKGKSDAKFDTTGSWFLLNVNSYCDALLSDASAHVASPEEAQSSAESFESTSSWFLENMNEYCHKTRPELVDHASTSGS